MDLYDGLYEKRRMRARDRGFSAFHPLVCFLYYVGAIALIMLGQHPAFLMSTVLIVIFLNLVQDNGKGMRNWWKAYLILPLFFFIIHPFINHRGSHILFYFQANPIMLEAVIKGAMMALTLLGLLLLFLSYNLVITADKFLYLFARVLPQWALLSMLAMRFVPLFRRRLTEIESVQRSKGLSITTGTLRSRVKHGGLFLQILLTWSLEEAIQTADSMKARGYGTGRRSQYQPFTFQGKDILALLFLVITFCVSLFGWWLGDLVLQLQPILESPILIDREWFFYWIGMAYFCFPLVIEGRERILWRS